MTGTVLTNTVLTDTAVAAGHAGETALFWVIAFLSVLGALGLVFSRKAVHGALSVAVTMIGLGLLYVAQDAPFLGIVQIVVYTGAIMMVFLFVIMLVGVDASDSRVETIKGQRVSGILAGLAFGVILVVVIGKANLPANAGLGQAQPDGNVQAIADLIFGRYVWAFEIASALLITAAMGAMLLAHRERIRPKVSQRELAIRRFRPADGDFSDGVGKPSPGIYARHNAVDTPGLLPDGTPAAASLPPTLVARADPQFGAPPEAHNVRDLVHDMRDAEDSDELVAGAERVPQPGGERR